MQRPNIYERYQPPSKSYDQQKKLCCVSSFKLCFTFSLRRLAVLSIPILSLFFPFFSTTIKQILFVPCVIHYISGAISLGQRRATARCSWVLRVPPNLHRDLPFWNRPCCCFFCCITSVGQAIRLGCAHGTWYLHNAILMDLRIHLMR